MDISNVTHKERAIYRRASKGVVKELRCLDTSCLSPRRQNVSWFLVEWKRKCHDIFKLFRTLFTTYVVHALCLSHVQWVTIHNARNIYIRRRRVPLSEVYSSISENFHLVYTSGIEQSCVEVGASVWYS